MDQICRSDEHQHANIYHNLQDSYLIPRHFRFRLDLVVHPHPDPYVGYSTIETVPLAPTHFVQSNRFAFDGASGAQQKMHLHLAKPSLLRAAHQQNFCTIS